jgi:hypothetical protein
MKNVVKLGIALLLFIMLISCTVNNTATKEIKDPYRTFTKVDEFDGFTINETQDNSVQLSGTESNWVELELQKYQKKDEIKYYIIVEYYGENWLNIESGESLVILIDGQRVGLFGDGSLNHRNIADSDYLKYLFFAYSMDTNTNISVEEKAWFEVTPEQLKMISEASEVKVKITGANYYVTKTFIPSTFVVFQSFYNEFVQEINETE